MLFHNAYQKLIASDSFKQWKHKNSHAFLAHGFFLDDELNHHQWQIGYYDKHTDKITTFFVTENEVSAAEQSEIFKKPDAVIDSLELDLVKISSDDAYSFAKAYAGKKYPHDPIQKVFMILQHLEKKTVYNITLLTQTLKTINLRIDAATKAVLFEKSTSLMEFRAE